MPTITLAHIAVKDPERVIAERSAWSYRTTTAHGWTDDGKRKSSVRGGDNAMSIKGYDGGKSVHASDCGNISATNRLNKKAEESSWISIICPKTKTAMAYPKSCFTGEGMFKKTIPKNRKNKLLRNYQCPACSVGGKKVQHTVNQWIVVRCNGVMVELMLTPKQAGDKLLRNVQATALAKKHGYIC
jgi:hypothetical protein